MTNEIWLQINNQFALKLMHFDVKIPQKKKWHKKIINLVTLGNPNCESGSVVTSLNGFGRNSAENSFLLQSQTPFFAFLCSVHRMPDFEVENTSAAFGLQLRFCETVRRGKYKEKRKRGLE